MCGIAGIIKYLSSRPPPWGPRPSSFAPLMAMSQAIAHRGPDGHGLFADNHAALLHSRLAIIDRSGGHQPMANEANNVHVVFNGEIYNHAQLRRELQSHGHIFKSDHSDTEVLVHGWEQWGTDLPTKLLGMFAFAIWDTRSADYQSRDREGATGSPDALPRGRSLTVAAPMAQGGGQKHTLFLARDRMGQKPLFYAILEDGLVFGSTIPSVLAWPEVPRRVPKEQIALYLLLGYFPAPQTIFRDVNQLLPGAWLRLQNDLLDGDRYWTPTSKIENRKSKIENLRENLTLAVSSQLIADTPITCFLSGGIDSSIIATLAQDAVQRAGGDPIQTVSVGFTESDFDESPYAQAVAQKIQSRHTQLTVHARQDVFATLSLLMQKSLGQPFADSSILPTYHLSRAARQVGGRAPVALSGDGADELFAGYDRYRAMILLNRFRPLVKFLPQSSPLGSLSKRERYRRLAAAAKSKIPSEQYTRLVDIFPRPFIEELMGEPVLDYFPLPEEYGLPDDVSPLRLAMLRDQSEYLPGDVLWKVDSASMCSASGDALEVRSPFLDHRIVELGNSFPDSALIHNGQGKAPLRQLFANDLPPAVLHRRKKGFGVPIGQWFNNQGGGDLRAPLTDLLLSQQSFTRNYLQPQIIERLLHEHHTALRDHTHRLFALLTLELFWQHFAPTLE
ncbi:MAG: asparagine synthase-related protein [Phycisphaerales bacterium]|nr:asparagine synthase-related protein [Phycisphaerales bacterium]